MIRIDALRATFAILMTLGFVILFAVYQARRETEQNFASDVPPGVELGLVGDNQAEVGKPPPYFVLMDINGRVVELAAYRGQVVLVNFWATWCLPCRREMPDLAAMYERYQTDGFVVVAVNLAESRDRAKKFADDYDLSFPVVLDTTSEVSRAYRLSGVPESWIIGRDGTVIDRRIGIYSRSALEALVPEWLRAGAETPPSLP